MKDRPRRVWLRLGAGLVIVLALALLGLIGANASPVLRTVAVGLAPGLAVVDAPRGRVFVANTNEGTVSVLDTRDGRLLHTTPVGMQTGRPSITPPSMLPAARSSSGREMMSSPRLTPPAARW